MANNRAGTALLKCNRCGALVQAVTRGVTRGRCPCGGARKPVRLIKLPRKPK